MSQLTDRGGEGGDQRIGGWGEWGWGRVGGWHTNRDEDVEQVLERRQLRNQLLNDFTERLEDRVVVDAGQVEAVGRRLLL